jgi:hypothetical protein
MLDALKNLFENNVISEDVKASIESAWEQRITENRTQVAQQLREEFAQRYEHDKSIMVEAVDRMLNDQLRNEIAQFVEDRSQLAEAKAELAVKAKQSEKAIKEFVSRQLAAEVQELHNDQMQMSDKFKTLETFVVEALAKEISEFYIDKNDLAATKVRLVREGREQFNKIKEQFIKRSSQLVESVVTQTLNHEIGQLKEDIEVARRNDFGRKLFEAFASEYTTSYLNEKTETAKLQKVIHHKESLLAESVSIINKAKVLIQNKDKELRSLSESKTRQEIMHQLLSPLASDKRQIMAELLESVQTPKLHNSFEKYLPAVIAGESVPKRKPLLEATEVTGNKKTSGVSSGEDYNIFDIRRLAGIKH